MNAANINLIFQQKGSGHRRLVKNNKNLVNMSISGAIQNNNLNNDMTGQVNFYP